MKNSILSKNVPTGLCAAAAILLFVSLFVGHSGSLAYAQPSVASAANSIGTTGNCSQAVAPAPAAAVGYNRLSFCDDFDSASTIDLHDTAGPGYKWYPHTPRNNLSPSQIRVAHSALTLVDTDFNYAWGLSTFSYRTNIGESFHFGYFEARISFDPRRRHIGGVGWPAFWALSERHVKDKHGKVQDPKPWAELDFFEAFKGTSAQYDAFFGGTVHDWRYDPSTDTLQDFRNKDDKFPTPVDWKNWHIVAGLWQKDKVTWYFDGMKLGEEEYPAATRGKQSVIDDQKGHAPVPKGVFQILNSEKMFLVLGAGPDWPMNVDWVRVWQ